MSRRALSRFVEVLEDRSTPAVAFALSNNSLLAFDTSNPTAALAPTAVTGLIAGDNLVGIDFRPQNGMLYGLGFNSVTGTVQLYNISPRSGTATAIGGSVAGITGSNFGFDFNPAADRIRVVTDSNPGQDFRLNPNTGALVMFDGAINAGTTKVDGAAYTNNTQSTTVTTLYTIDSSTDTLFIQNPPNSGTQSNPLPITLGGAALDFSAANGFDIPAGVNAAASNAAVTSGSAFAALTVGGVTGLYQIDLTTGAATFVGNLSAGALPVQGLAIWSDVSGVPSIGLSADGTQLIRSSSGTQVPVAITGVDAGDTLVGIDYRPSTGQLFGLGVNAVTGDGTLYRLDPQSGAATVIGGVGNVNLATALPAATVGYGFDFNPVVDRIRVVTGNGLNFRINPNDGTATADADINGGGISGATGAAYTNSFGGVTTTTLYVLDAATNSLSIQNPPNAGTQTMILPVTLNGVAIDFTAVNGFDIPAGVTVATSNTAASGFGYATLTVGGVTSAYSINLATGAAALLLPTGGPSAGLALGDSPAGAVAFLPPIGGDGTIVVTEGGTATINLIRTGGSVGTVTVQVVQTGGTAVAGLDYNGLPATVTFADGQTTATIVLTLPNDSTADGTKTLILGFNNPTNGVVFAAPSAQNVTIQDASNPLLVGYKEFGVGQDTGGTQATLYRQDQSVGFTTTPFAGFTGGVRTAVGDVNGDGVGDLIVATGPGSTGRVIILDGVTQAQLFSVNPFEASFTGGLFVAVGDINADGIADIVVTPDQTGGPRVVVFLGGTFTLFASFFGIDDPNFRGGARAAVADVNGDGFGDIIVAAGFGGGPRVALFSGATVGTSAPTKLLPDFFVFEQTLRNGVFVAGGDVTGDGFADMMFGGGPGGGPRVLIVDGAGALTAGGVDLAANPGLVLTNFFAGDPNNRGGIRLAAKNLDNDGLADLVTGSGTGAGSQVTTYLGSVLGSGGSTFNTLFPAFPGFNGGIFVG